MGLETATFIADLVDTNPTSGDPRSQGDDHLRLLKEVLQATFPAASKAFRFPASEAKSANFTVVAADQHKLFTISTSGGAVTATLPTLTAGDAGWECSFVKTGTSTNPYFIAPASGTIQSGGISGLAKTRRSIPGCPVKAVWTGSAWFATRAIGVPVGTLLDNWQSSVPVGFENPNGATLGSASTNYPDYFSANGSSGVLPDVTGRVKYGKEATATRLTSGVSGIDGATKGSAGGSQSVVIAQANLPSVNLSHSLSGEDHTHGVGSYAVGSHTHGLGTLAVTVGSHTHGAGSFALIDLSITNGTSVARNPTTNNNLTGGGGGNYVQNAGTATLSLTDGTVGGTSGATAPSASVSGALANATPSFSGNSGASGSLAISGTVALGGSGAAISRVGPGIVVQALIVVE